MPAARNRRRMASNRRSKNGPIQARKPAARKTERHAVGAVDKQSPLAVPANVPAQGVTTICRVPRSHKSIGVRLQTINQASECGIDKTLMCNTSQQRRLSSPRRGAALRHVRGLVPGEYRPCRIEIVNLRQPILQVKPRRLRAWRRARFSLALQLKNVKGYPVLNVKVVFPCIIQQFLKFPVEFFDLFTR